MLSRLFQMQGHPYLFALHRLSGKVFFFGVIGVKCCSGNSGEAVACFQGDFFCDAFNVFLSVCLRSYNATPQRRAIAPARFLKSQ